MYPSSRSMESKVAKYNIHAMIEKGLGSSGDRVTNSIEAEGQDQSRLHKVLKDT